MPVNPSQDESFLSKINQFLDENLEDENYGVAELVISLGASRTQLHRKLKSISGKSTSSYIREYRLKKAHEMLRNDVATASEIAYRVGFASPSYFSTAFSKFYGYSPGEAKYQKDVVKPVRKKSKLPLWIATGVLLIGLIGYWGYQGGNDQAIEKILPVALSEDKEKTIAILAFEDLSEDQSQKYLGMGLAVEVINILDDVEGLKLIGKTSAFSFLDKKVAIDSIARLLNVNYILEGTISESEEEIEVIALLIDGVTGQTLSSQSYKRPKEEVSKIKSEIAKQVAYELKIKVNEDVLLSSNRNDARLLAIEQRAYYRISKGASRAEVIGIWDECLSLDSTYIPCLANRAKYSNGPEDLLSYVKRLEALDSTNAYTYFVKGNYFFYVKLDFQKAYLYYKKTLDKKPSDTRILSDAACRLGRFDMEKGMESLLFSMKKDPLYFNNYSNLAHLYLLKGEYKKSIDLLYEKMIMTDSNFPWEIIFANIYGGYYEEAEIALTEYLSNPLPHATKNDKEVMVITTELFLAAVRKENLEFEKKLQQYTERRYNFGIFPIACALALYGDNDRGFEWLERGYETKSMGYYYELKYAPWFKDMRNDPRWPVFMKKLKMPGYEDDKIKT